MIAKNLEIKYTADGYPIVSVQLTTKKIPSFDKDTLLDVTIKKHRNKRSLTANGGLWMLLQRLAEVLGTSKDELYLQFLEQYGTFTHIVVKPSAVDKVKQEWRTVRELGEVTINGKKIMAKKCTAPGRIFPGRLGAACRGVMKRR